MTQPADHDRAATSLSLLQRARARDDEAWRRLLQLYRPLVLYWCARRGARGEDGDDIAQEVFRAAAAGLEAFRRDRPGDSFRAWLRGITNVLLAQHFRLAERDVRAAGGSDAAQRLQQVAASPQSPDEDDPAEQVNDLHRRALELIRGEFEERSWLIFRRTVIDGNSPAEVAAEFGVTAAAVRQVKSRVLRRLREEAGELLD
jgi:RNA polymerase sigma-70 factor (ECF subfamily)